MYNHVQDDHSGYEKFLYNHVGGFLGTGSMPLQSVGVLADCFRDVQGRSGAGRTSRDPGKQQSSDSSLKIKWIDADRSTIGRHAADA
jgi:hypothetical protein